MKRAIYTTLVAVACTVTASAQSGMAGDKMAQDKMGKDAAKSVMVSGCVAESDGKFMLNNAMMMDHAGMAGGAAMAPGLTAPAAPGASAKAGAMAPGMSGAPMSYMLTGGTLKPHVGHKVEITGTMTPMANDMAKGSMAKEPAAPGAMAKGDMKSSPTLAVKELKMVAPTCS